MLEYPGIKCIEIKTEVCSELVIHHTVLYPCGLKSPEIFKFIEKPYVY